MPKVLLKGLHVVRSKGRIYCYAWRGGPRLHAELGTPEFHAAFTEARNPLAGLDTKRLSAWISLYKASDEFKRLADTTRRVWAPWLDLIRDEFGELSIRQFDRPKIRVDIRRWRNKWKDRPRAADTGKQVLSRILSYAVAEGGLAANPCDGLPNLYQSNRAEVIWDADSLERLCKAASPEVANAARLAALTGLRQADLLKLAWSHVGGNAIEVSTGKSRGKRTAIIPLTRDLKRLLKAIPRRSTVILTNSDGQPWRGFGSSWNKAMKASGLAESGLHFHDLRGTAATNFYRAGFSTREIAQTLAWSEEKVDRLIDRYVKRNEILRDRIRRMDKIKRR